LPDTLAFDFTSSAAVPSRLVEQARVDARAVGYAQGWAQGLHEATESQSAQLAASHQDRNVLLAAHQQELASALRALRTAAAQLEARTVELTDDLEDKILAAAVELAEALLGRELRDPAVAAPAALARVLALAPANEPVTVWLSSSDYDLLTSTGGTALAATAEGAGGRSISYQIDPALQPGEALGRCGCTTIDARLADGVDRLRKYLSR
jgi:flagellar assembly protein FliH